MKSTSKSPKRSVVSYQEAIAKARNILHLSADEKKHFLNSFDYVMSDFEGVIWNFDTEAEDSGKAIMLLRGAGKQYKFVTSNSLHTNQYCIDRLRFINVTQVENADLVHPIQTMIRYIQPQDMEHRVFSICSQETNEALRGAGITLSTVSPNTSLNAENLIQNIHPDDSVSAVVADFNYNITYHELARAQQYLLKTDDCVLLVGGSNTYQRVGKDVMGIGNSEFINILRETTNKEPIILGKPEKRVGEDIRRCYEIKDPSRVLFVGGSLIDDIKFGIKCGFKTMFVLTGPSTEAHMHSLPETMKPDYMSDKLGDIVQILK